MGGKQQSLDQKIEQSLDQKIEKDIKLVYTNQYTTHVSEAQRQAAMFLCNIQQENQSQKKLSQSQETLIDYVLGNEPVQPHEVLLNIRPTHRRLLAGGRSLKKFDAEFFEQKCNFDQKIKVLEGYKEKHKAASHDSSENILGLSRQQDFEAKIMEVKKSALSQIKTVKISGGLMKFSGIKTKDSQSPAHILAVVAVTGEAGTYGRSRVKKLSGILGCDFTNKQQRDEAVQKLLTPAEYKQYNYAKMDYSSNLTANSRMIGVRVDSNDNQKTGVERLASFIDSKIQLP